MRGFTNEKVKLNMVKLTMVGRVRDGVPLAQGIRYVNEETDDVLGYKQQAEFILKQISRGALSSPKMAIQMHHHSFMYRSNSLFFTLISTYRVKISF